MEHNIRYHGLNLGRPVQRDDDWIHIAVYSKSGSAIRGVIKLNVRANLAKYYTAQELFDDDL